MNAKDIEALRVLYVGNRQELYTYAVSITGNRETAEDAIHGVFERLLRGSTPPTDLRACVFRSVRNAAFDTWRRAKVRTDSIFAAAREREIVQPESQPTAHPDDFVSLLQRLEEDERETIVLKLYGGLTFREIAEMRGTALPTVASWYRRGLERLQAILNSETR